MDRETVLHHLRAWADGVDASTGAALPLDHPGQRPDTLRVIFAALALLQPTPAPIASRAEENRPSAGGPRNAGRSWSADDDATLSRGFDGGETIGALAARLERTRGSISARLVKLGKIDPPPGMRLRGEPAPYAEVPTLG